MQTGSVHSHAVIYLPKEPVLSPSLTTLMNVAPRGSLTTPATSASPVYRADIHKGNLTQVMQQASGRSENIVGGGGRS